MKFGTQMKQAGLLYSTLSLLFDRTKAQGNVSPTYATRGRGEDRHLHQLSKVALDIYCKVHLSWEDTQYVTNWLNNVTIYPVCW